MYLKYLAFTSYEYFLHILTCNDLGIKHGLDKLDLTMLMRANQPLPVRKI